MALTATMAVALAAWLGCVATGGFRLGEFVVSPTFYGLALLAGVVAVAAGRRPGGPAVPAAALRFGRIALLFMALYLFSGRGRPPGITGLVTVLGLSVVALALLWPRPGALRLALAFSVVSLLGPPSPDAHRTTALLAMAMAVAVALVATGRLATDALPGLGGLPAPGRPWRTAGDVAAVAAVLALAGLGALLVDPEATGSAGPLPEAGAPPDAEDPGPLSLRPGVDPAGAGLGRGGDGRQVVLRVDAERPDVWRAQTFEEWDGRRWVPSPPRPEDQAPGPLVWVPLDEVERSPTEQLAQRVRIEAPVAEVVVGAPKAYFFHLPGGAVVSPDGTVRPTPALGRGATYETTSARSPSTPAMLRDRPPPLSTGASSELPRLSRRSEALVQRVTGSASSAYDKMAALQVALGTLRVDDGAPALPAGADVVDTVLFEQRAGSPERLATVLALLGRAAGVPTRLAVGFLPGQRPLSGGDFVVRARDAHAWVEVPFPGLGWQRFDPTGRIAAAERQDSFWSRLLRLVGRWWPVLVVLVALAVAVAARWLVRRNRRHRGVPWAARYLARLARVGARRGRPRRPAETPAEYAAALADEVLADERLHRVGQLVTEAAWSGRPVPEESRRWAEEVLREAAGRRRRRR